MKHEDLNRADRKVRRALQLLLDQIYQIEDLIDDDDGTLAEAIATAENALED